MNFTNEYACVTTTWIKIRDIPRTPEGSFAPLTVSNAPQDHWSDLHHVALGLHMSDVQYILFCIWFIPSIQLTYKVVVCSTSFEKNE